MDDTLENPRSLVDHNHPADQTRVELNKLRTNMKSQARQSRSRPNDIVSHALLNASEAVRANMSACRHDMESVKIKNLFLLECSMHARASSMARASAVKMEL